MEEDPPKILDNNEVTWSLSEVACGDPDTVLLSSIVIVDSPFTPISSPSSLPLVSSGSPSSIPLLPSVPLAAFENPIEELADEEVIRAVDASDELAVLDVISDVVIDDRVDVAEATVSRSMVDAPVSLATLPVFGSTEDQIEL